MVSSDFIGSSDKSRMLDASRHLDKVGPVEPRAWELRREAQATGRLGDHPHIVQVCDLGVEDGQLFMVMPLP